MERVFRDMKSMLETRPVYHQNDANIAGHVFCSFLALVLRKELEQRLTMPATSLSGLISSRISRRSKRWRYRKAIRGLRSAVSAGALRQNFSGGESCPTAADDKAAGLKPATSVKR